MWRYSIIGQDTHHKYVWWESRPPPPNQSREHPYGHQEQGVVTRVPTPSTNANSCVHASYHLNVLCP